MLKRKKLHIDGINISYAEVNEEAENIIFFFHGNGNSADLWINQFKSPLFAGYRLIAFDLPSHGQSQPLKAPDSTLLRIAEIMAQCVQQLSYSRLYLLCGLSLGGNVIAEMLAHSQVTPIALILAGSNFVGQGITAKEIISEEWVNEVLFTDRASVEVIQSYFEKASLAGDKQQLFYDYLTTDSSFRSAFAASAAAGLYSDEVTLLQNIKKPILMCFGAEDTICSAKLNSKLHPYLWQKKIHVIEKAAHILVLDQPDVFNNLLSAFLETCVQQHQT